MSMAPATRKLMPELVAGDQCHPDPAPAALTRARREFVLVDAEADTRGPAFDHRRLAEGLSKAAETKYGAEHLPFDQIELAADNKAVKFQVGETWWVCKLDTYECSRTTPPTDHP